ncbi:peptidyl-prolyl cis-trans isomerase sig-7 [Eupeodes corollae]|uniref:peptidyl-prolyl cis-trans isomerase sig-7 n=1 Tax=Eupeodes corollae TaxID=290404 RepID=UPI002493C09C|nr:peptidyl-prolyl cis-trans isomerase sig-7 [Eupeodes corollae]
MAVVIETTLGDITVDLFIEERPRACLNFIKLCKLKYYNYNLFHTIERDFIAQTGDPTGAGDGGESVWGVVEGSHKRFFEAESLPKIKHTIPGLLSLVSVGKFMVGSQFFFTLGPDLTSLDAVHCVIGEVVEGREILRKMNEAIVDEKFRPYQDIRVTHTVILDDPFSDPRGFQVPNRSPSPSAERMINGRIGADEDIDDTAGKTPEEIQEMLAEREAKARATILEIVGDLPDADIAPPENVLFVCKLNPVTTDDDLEIIFSRFGKVKGCEVIRDKLSGDSLQYAFVEFEDQKSCEAAYFKMDNVLIDDRRIHVDFSQSVSKVQWRGKGRGLVHKDEKDRKLDFNNLRGNNRGGERQRNRDQSRSPVRRSDKNSRLEDYKRSSNRAASPQPKRRQDERPPRRSSHYRSNSREKPSSKRRESPKDRRPVRQRSNSRSPVQRRRDSPTKISQTKERRRSPVQKSRHRSTSGDRNRPRNRSPDDRQRRRSPPGNDRRRIPDRPSARHEQERRRNFDESSRSREQRRKSPPSRNETDRRGNNDGSRLKVDRINMPQENREKPRRSESSSVAAKSKEKHPKSKKSKRRKSVTSSSSSSGSESDSSTSSSESSSSPSSSSSDDKRKKSKKSKKSTKQKSKKQPKKKSKKHNSSSSSD